MPKKEKLPISLLYDHDLDAEINKDQDIYASDSLDDLHKKTQKKRRLAEQLILAKNFAVKKINELPVNAKSVKPLKKWQSKPLYWIILQIDEAKNVNEIDDFLEKIELPSIAKELRDFK